MNNMVLACKWSCVLLRGGERCCGLVGGGHGVPLLLLRASIIATLLCQKLRFSSACIHAWECVAVALNSRRASSLAARAISRPRSVYFLYFCSMVSSVVRWLDAITHTLLVQGECVKKKLSTILSTCNCLTIY